MILPADDYLCVPDFAACIAANKCSHTSAAALPFLDAGMAASTLAMLLRLFAASSFELSNSSSSAETADAVNWSNSNSFIPPGAECRRVHGCERAASMLGNAANCSAVVSVQVGASGCHSLDVATCPNVSSAL